MTAFANEGRDGTPGRSHKAGDVLHVFTGGRIQMLTDVAIDPAGKSSNGADDVCHVIHFSLPTSFASILLNHLHSRKGLTIDERRTVAHPAIASLMTAS